MEISYKEVIATVLWSQMDNDTLSARIDLPDGYAFSDYDFISVKLDGGEYSALEDSSFTVSEPDISRTAHSVFIKLGYQGETDERELKLRSWWRDTPKIPASLRPAKHAGMKDNVAATPVLIQEEV
jgi:hypothetical protein